MDSLESLCHEENISDFVLAVCMPVMYVVDVFGLPSTQPANYRPYRTYVYVCMYVCLYECMSVPINQTNRYILYSLNTDYINNSIKTSSLCMYVQYYMYVCMQVYNILENVSFCIVFYCFYRVIPWADISQRNTRCATLTEYNL